MNVTKNLRLSALCMAAVAALSACGGGDADISNDNTAADAEGRAHALTVTPTTNSSGTTSLSLSTSANYTFASETPANGAAGQVTAVVQTTGKTVTSEQLQILPGDAVRPPLKVTDANCSTGTKTATKWTCKAQVALDGPASLRRPYSVTVSSSASATGGGSTDNVSATTGLSLLPPDTYLYTGISLFNGVSQKTRWGLKTTDGGGTDRAVSLHLPNGKSYMFFGDTLWNDLFSFTFANGNTLTDGWLKPGAGQQFFEYDFRRGSRMYLAQNDYLVKPASTVDIKGLVNSIDQTLMYAYNMTAGPTSQSMAPASQVGTYLGRMNMMSPATADIRVKEYFGYTVSASGSNYVVNGVTSATSIGLDGTGHLVYTPGQVRCTVTGTLAAGTSEYATVPLVFSGANCTLAGKTISSVVVYNYGANKYMTGGVDGAWTSAGMSFTTKVN